MATHTSRCLRAQVISPAVASAVVINKYDAVEITSSAIRPIDYDANADGTGDNWDTDEATTQGAIKDKFLGIAMEQSRSGDTKPIMVATDIELYVDCASASHALGAGLRAQKAAGSNVVNQAYKAATNATDAIARVVEATTSATKVWARFRGTLTEDGVATPTT